LDPACSQVSRLRLDAGRFRASAVLPAHPAVRPFFRVINSGPVLDPEGKRTRAGISYVKHGADAEGAAGRRGRVVRLPCVRTQSTRKIRRWWLSPGSAPEPTVIDQDMLYERQASESGSAPPAQPALSPDDADACPKTTRSGRLGAAKQQADAWLSLLRLGKVRGELGHAAPFLQQSTPRGGC